VHDRTAAASLQRPRRLCGEELAFQDRVEKPVVLLLGDVDEGLRAEHARVVGEQLQPTKASLGEIDDGATGPRVADVAGERRDTRVARVDLVCGGLERRRCLPRFGAPAQPTRPVWGRDRTPTRAANVKHTDPSSSIAPLTPQASSGIAIS